MSAVPKPVAALIVGGIVLKMGWDFGWEALHNLMDQSAESGGCHHRRDVAAELSAAEGHAIVLEVEDRMRARHRALGMMRMSIPDRCRYAAEPVYAAGLASSAKNVSIAVMATMVTGTATMTDAGPSRIEKTSVEKIEITGGNETDRSSTIGVTKLRSTK